MRKRLTQSKLEKAVKAVSAACRVDGLTYSMPAPARHHDILLRMPTPERHLCTQGFLLSDGRFIEREGARVVAIDTKQVKDMSVLHARELFSEDLW